MDLGCNKPIHSWYNRSICNSIAIRIPRTKKLHIITGMTVVWVIKNGVIVLSSGAVYALGMIGHIVIVAVRAVINWIFETLDCLAAQKVVNRAVFHDEDNHILNLLLQVRN